MSYSINRRNIQVTIKWIIILCFLEIWVQLFSLSYDIAGTWETSDCDENNSISIIYEFKENSVTIFSTINRSIKSKSEYQYIINDNLLHIYRYKKGNNADIIKESWFIIREINKNQILLEAANNAGKEPTGAVLILKKAKWNK